MDASDFTQASRAVWEAMAPGWDQRHAYFEETARPMAERMLERLAPALGEVILELAAGTGTIGFASAAQVGTGGCVIVSHLSVAMVAAARRHADQLRDTNDDCRVLDAERLDLPDDSVDGVLCRWGNMLMADQATAFVETHRGLRHGRRLVCAVFARPEQNPWVALPSWVLLERGHMPPAAAGAPGILALADRDRLRGPFKQAGFENPRIDEVAFTWKFSDFDDYWDFLAGAARAIALVLGRVQTDELRLVREQVAQEVGSFGGTIGIELARAHGVSRQTVRRAHQALALLT
jgi:ubiquinone/menaquinone biosynthesis C-methylase UbiE